MSDWNVGRLLPGYRTSSSRRSTVSWLASSATIGKTVHYSHSHACCAHSRLHVMRRILDNRSSIVIQRAACLSFYYWWCVNVNLRPQLCTGYSVIKYSQKVVKGGFKRTIQGSNVVAEDGSDDRFLWRTTDPAATA